jgi:hypothetical protein
VPPSTRNTLQAAPVGQAGASGTLQFRILLSSLGSRQLIEYCGKYCALEHR